MLCSWLAGAAGQFGPKTAAEYKFVLAVNRSCRTLSAPRFRCLACIAHECCSVSRFASRSDAAAQRGHDRVHRHVAVGPAAWRHQPRAGFPGLQLRPAPAGAADRGDGCRPQPVRADAGRAGAAPGHQREECPAVRTPLRRRRRGNHHRRRHPGHHGSGARAGGPGRRGDRPGAGVRQLRALDRAGRRPHRARAAGGRARLRPRLGAGARRHHAAHAAHHAQLSAQPDRALPGRRRPAGARGHRRGHRSAAAVRRGLRAHRLRRPAASFAGRLAPAGSPHGAGLQLRQDLPHHRLEGRDPVRAARADGRDPQGAPVHGVCRQHAGAARFRRLPARSAAVRDAAGVLSGQARPLRGRPARDALSRAALPRDLLRAGRLQRGQRAAGGAVRAADDRRLGRGGDPGVGVLRPAGRPPRGALLLCQARRHAARRARAAGAGDD